MCARRGHRQDGRSVIEKGKKAAAHLLEASESDIQFRNGAFEVVGTDRKISLFETARRAKEIGRAARQQGEG